MTIDVRLIEEQMAKEMCLRVDIPWSLGRVILSMVRVSYDGLTRMQVYAIAIKYTSDNRHLLKRPIKVWRYV